MTLQGDARRLPLADESVQCVVTSPPYWGLRVYEGVQPLVWRGERNCNLVEHIWSGLGAHGRRGKRGISGTGGNLHPTLDATGQGPGSGGGGQFCLQCGAWRGSLGLEPTPELYVSHLVEIFREVRGVLRRDGTVWLNLGDSYTTGASTAPRKSDPKAVGDVSVGLNRVGTPPGLKPKDLCGIPWMVAFALQADGWWLRSDIIWSKPNPMPESVRDRPTRSHEYLFLLAKSANYYYDADAVREGCQEVSVARAGRADLRTKKGYTEAHGGNPPIRKRALLPGRDRESHENFSERWKLQEQWAPSNGRNKRSVWTLATYPVKEAHFATYPPELIEPCILAGCPEGGTVLDPFAGTGTTGLACLKHGRRYIGVELSPQYIEIARARVERHYSLLTQGAS